MNKQEIEAKEKRAFWSKHLKNCKESSLTQAKYCRKNQLQDNQMIYWRQKIKKAKTKNSENYSEISFVQLPSLDKVQLPMNEDYKIPEPSYLTPSLKLNLGNEYQIEMEKGFDQLTLMQVRKVYCFRHFRHFHRHFRLFLIVIIIILK